MLRCALRFHPFSHLPAAVCLLPKTRLKLRVFPARVEFFDCGAEHPLFHLTLDVQGPVEEFTTVVDLERYQVRVWGKTARGFLRYTLERSPQGVTFTAEKVPGEALAVQGNSPFVLRAKEKILFPWTWRETPPPPTEERLSLGIHKQQEWEGIKRRLDFKEIFPLWMRLGQHTPLPETSPADPLLERCRSVVQGKRKMDILEAFKHLFLAGFEGILVPRLFDADYQGIAAGQKISPAALTQGAALIRSLFFCEENEVLEILPLLPPDFPAGRFLGVRSRAGDRIDMEWTKKQLRRLIIQRASDLPLQFLLPAVLKRCRVRYTEKERGREENVKEGRLLVESPKQLVIVDRFER